MLRDRIKFYRKLRGMSMETLSGDGTDDRVCALKTLSLIESGTTASPSVDIVMGLARRLETSPGSLIENRPTFGDLEGLCHDATQGVQIYLHRACADKVAHWLNTSSEKDAIAPEWTAVKLARGHEVDFVLSDRCPLEISGIVVGYIATREHLERYRALLEDYPLF